LIIKIDNKNKIHTNVETYNDFVIMGGQQSTTFATSASAERSRIKSLRLKPFSEVFPKGTKLYHSVGIGQIQEQDYISVQMILSPTSETCLELRRPHFQNFCEWFMTIRDNFTEMTQIEFTEYVSHKINTLNIKKGERKQVIIQLTLLSAM
jgi:hypothetical protein